MSINETSVILGKYKGLEIEKPEISFTEEEIRAVFEKRRNELAVIEEVKDRGIEPGDIAYIDFSASYRTEVFEGSHAEDFPLEIGSGDFLPGFDRQLELLEAGDRITITVTMPEDYRDYRVAGKDIPFRVLIKKVQKPIYPVYEEVREQILKEMTEERQLELDDQLEDRILEMLVENSTILVEESLLKDAMEKEFQMWVESVEAQGFNPRKYLRVYGSNEDEQRAILRPKAEFRVKSALALDAVAEKEGLTASPEEIDAQIAEIAAHFDMPPAVLKERFDEAAMESVKSDVLSYKAMELMKENVIWK